MSNGLQIGLFLAAIFTAFGGYFYCFSLAVQDIIAIFNKKQQDARDIYWSFGISGVGSIALYFLIFYFYLNLKYYPIVDKDILEFIKNANDKIFSFLLAALIAQFLGSLFSRQQFEYQTKLAENKAKADKIENIVKILEKELSNRVLKIQNMLGFFEKFKYQLDNQPDEKSCKLLHESLKPTENRIRHDFDTAKDSWHIKVNDIHMESAVLNIQPISDYIYGPINGFLIDAHNNTQFGDTQKQNKARESLGRLAPYRSVAFTILLTLAKAARNDKIITCPSFQQLQDFTDDANHEKIRQWVQTST